MFFKVGHRPSRPKITGGEGRGGGCRFQLRPKNKVQSLQEIPNGLDYCQTPKTVDT